MTARKTPQDAPAAPRRATKPAPKPADSGPETPAKPARKRAARTRTPAKPAVAEPKLSAGDRLRADMAAPGDSVPRSVLIAQAARVADRLETLAALLDADPAVWARVKVGRDVVSLVVTDVVREERQQSEVLRKLLADLARPLPGVKGGSGDGGKAGVPDDALLRIVERHYGVG